MTENTSVITSWLEGLAARGVAVSIRNGRLHLIPASAYRTLTDEEVLTLRHYRDAIKERIREGGAPPVAVTLPAATPAAAAQPAQCAWCYQAPCIGPEHPHFYTLHPLADRQREEDRKDAEFRHYFGLGR